MARRLTLILVLLLAWTGAAQAAPKCVRFLNRCDTMTLNTDDLLLGQVHGIYSQQACASGPWTSVVSGTFVDGEIRVTTCLSESCNEEMVYFVLRLASNRAWTFFQDGTESVYVGDDRGLTFTVTDGACRVQGQGGAAPRPSLLDLLQDR